MKDLLTPQELRIIRAEAIKVIALGAGMDAALEFAFDHSQHIRWKRAEDLGAYSDQEHLIASTRAAARNRGRDLDRRAQVRGEVPETAEELEDALPSGEVDPLTALMSGEARFYVRRELDAMPEKQARCIRLRYLEGLPGWQVAQEVGCSEEQAWSFIALGLVRLRKGLAWYAEDNGYTGKGRQQQEGR